MTRRTKQNKNPLRKYAYMYGNAATGCRHGMVKAHGIIEATAMINKRHPAHHQVRGIRLEGEPYKEDIRYMKPM